MDVPKLSDAVSLRFPPPKVFSIFTPFDVLTTSSFRRHSSFFSADNIFRDFHLPRFFRVFHLPTSFWELTANLNLIFFSLPTFEISTYRRLYEISAHRRPLKNLLVVFKENVEKISILAYNMSEIESIWRNHYKHQKFLPTNNFLRFRLPRCFRVFNLPTSFWGPPADLNSICFFCRPTFEISTYRRFYETSAYRRSPKDLSESLKKKVWKKSLF